MADQSYKDIAQRIKQRRLELKLSLQDIADLTGMSKSTLQRYETGSIKNIPLQRIESLATALQITPDWIMGGDDWYKDIVQFLLDAGPNNGVLQYKIPPQDILREQFDNFDDAIPPNLLIGACCRSYLTTDEVSLITAYRNFTKEGKQKIKEYMGDLGENPKYITSKETIE